MRTPASIFQALKAFSKVSTAISHTPGVLDPPVYHAFGYPRSPGLLIPVSGDVGRNDLYQRLHVGLIGQIASAIISTVLSLVRSFLVRFSAADSQLPIVLWQVRPLRTSQTISPPNMQAFQPLYILKPVGLIANWATSLHWIFSQLPLPYHYTLPVLCDILQYRRRMGRLSPVGAKALMRSSR